MATPAAATVASAVMPGLSAQVDIAYSLNESAASTPNRPTTYSTDDPDDDEDEREERLLPANRPRRRSFDVALHEDPLFHTTHPCTKKLRHAFKKSWGLVLMLISSAMLSTSTLIVSLLSPNFTTWELSAWRLLGQWVCTLVFFQYTKKSLRFEQAAMKAMVLRCFAGLGSMLFLYMAVKHMAMANATVIRYTSPVMVAVMAKIVSQRLPSQLVWRCHVWPPGGRGIGDVCSATHLAHPRCTPHPSLSSAATGMGRAVHMGPRAVLLL